VSNTPSPERPPNVKGPLRLCYAPLLFPLSRSVCAMGSQESLPFPLLPLSFFSSAPLAQLSLSVRREFLRNFKAYRLFPSSLCGPEYAYTPSNPRPSEVVSPSVFSIPPRSGWVPEAYKSFLEPNRIDLGSFLFPPPQTMIERLAETVPPLAIFLYQKMYH